MAHNSGPTQQTDGDGEHPHVEELGGVVGGERVKLNRRMFLQLLAYGDCRDTAEPLAQLREAGIPSVLYEDANDPYGVAAVIAYEDSARFVDELRPFLQRSCFSSFTPKPELTMFGRTYAIGYEKDLHHALLQKPMERLGDPEASWAIWYPLRRRGVYETLSAEEQHDVQTEHMRIGRAFARVAGITDIRLACHGLDRNDNDFVVALLGAQLAPLSLIVQRMRKCKQTSLYLETLGPFFVGKVAGRAIPPAGDVTAEG
jgi:chlorite dismutase